jgi:hypothetical protein
MKRQPYYLVIYDLTGATNVPGKLHPKIMISSPCCLPLGEEPSTFATLGSVIMT